MLAVKTARDFARTTKPQIKEPEAILPVTAHAAFHKGCHYTGVKKVLVPVDPKTFKADPVAIEKAITANTVLIVSSAVSYAHGVLDPIEEIARIAQKHNLLFHVDGCIGGFLLPFFKRLGDEARRIRFPGARLSPRCRWTSTNTRMPPRARLSFCIVRRSCAAFRCS